MPFEFTVRMNNYSPAFTARPNTYAPAFTARPNTYAPAITHGGEGVDQSSGDNLRSDPFPKQKIS